MKRVLILGATSAIAGEVATLFAQRGDALGLVARDAAKLDATVRHLEIIGDGRSAIHRRVADAVEFEKHGQAVAEAIAELGGLDIAMIAYGHLSDQPACERDPELARRELELNFLSVVSCSISLANYFESQKRGCLAVIGSVAGDRGRASNSIYGAAKGGIDVFFSGLRQRLAPSGVQVLTIKPGFVDTPMTAAVPKNFLFASPERVAAGIVRAIDRGADVVYLPWFWRWIMLVIRMIPESLFRRLRL